ncbi:MAG: inner membrane CreD family protein [Candidatus Eremiobacteraeota bacterium]|nr:inner membrane CreD family protein [Candidatus Eremiobacteraeota bacterium]
MKSSSYLFAVALVVIAATTGWAILAQTLVLRTDAADSSQRQQLAALWGTAQTQTAPRFSIGWMTRDGNHHLVETESQIAPMSARVDVDLALDQRQKGLLWYNTYTVGFAATYRVTADRDGRLIVRFPFPAADATYEDVVFTMNGKPIAATNGDGHLTASLPIARGQSAELAVGYRSHGLDTWRYRFGDDAIVGVRDFRLTMRTNFDAIDFPPQTLSPTEEKRTGGGWTLTWNYSQLVNGFGIGMAFPQKLQPGPIAQRITMWAPLSLSFYVFVMLVVTRLRRIELHPMNYLFLAAAFFAFHLLFAYTVDRIPLGWAFLLCSMVSMALTVSYLRLVVGLRFAAVEAALAQFFYLILFSYALFDEGYSGLSITTGAIVTLFVMMQLTGRFNWSSVTGGGTRTPAETTA